MRTRKLGELRASLAAVTCFLQVQRRISPVAHLYGRLPARLLSLAAGAGLALLSTFIIPPLVYAAELPDALVSDNERSDLILQYCVDCHNPEDYSGRLDFWSLDLTDLHGQREVWEKVLRKLQSNAMPPNGEPRPASEYMQNFLTNLEQELDTLAGANLNAGRAPLHRLNRAEYANAVRDLLGVEVDVSGLLPPDNESYGFDNIADVLGITPVLLEQYLSASAKISSLAVGNPATGAVARTYRNRADFSQDVHLEGLPLGTRGGILVQHNFPVDGDYELGVVLGRNTADVLRGLEEAHDLDFLLSGVPVYSTTVGGAADTRAITENSDAARSLIGERLRLRLHVAAGAHEVGVTFVQRSYALNDHQLQPFIRTTIDPVDEVGPPHVDGLVITGPLVVTGPGNSLSRKKIFSCDPALHPQGEDGCAEDILSRLASQAYRRPVDEEDMGPLMRMYAAGRSADSEGGFDRGIEQGLRLILSNPNFIFRFETDPEALASGSTYLLDDLQLASRLSFFLWSSLPDTELIETALAGKLNEPEMLRRQTARMLADPKAQALVENFAGQYLLLRNLNGITPNPNLFPDFDDNLRSAMRQETELFFASLINEDRSALDLLNADYSFINERLARHYGIPGVYGSRFRRVSVPEERRGLLGQGSILTVTSYATRTSPVQRGKWILTNLLGTPPPPPPPNIPDLKATSDDGVALSVRDQMVQHRRNPSCASCHNLMDPLGLALENFDAIGRWRDLDNLGHVVDASGELVDGTPINGPGSLRQALLSKPDLFVTTFTEKLFTYALGRGLTYEDAALVRQVIRKARNDNYRMSALLEGIVTSVPFRMKTKTDVTRTQPASAAALATNP